MNGRGSHDAALYALGCLTGVEARVFEEHLQRCSRCVAELAEFGRVTSALALLTAPADPPPELRQRLLARVASSPGGAAAERPTQSWKNWAASSTRVGPIVVRAADGAWESTGVAGVSAKALFVDPENDRVTMLVRMEPRATYPAHLHGGPEESFILEGDLADGEVFLRAGDYLRKDGGSLHGVQSTERGCLMLIVSSLHDELVGDAPRV